MVKCWVSDTLTTIHGLTNDDCKNAIDEISENISLMEIMMGGEGSGHRCGDLCSSVGRRQRCLHTNDETSLLLRAAPHCCCCCKKTVVPPGRMFEPINIHLMWSWKPVRWKQKDERKMRTLNAKRRKLLLLLLVLNVYKKYEVQLLC